MNLLPHYETLGLPPGSPLAAVKKAYLREIKIWHPDRYSPNSLLRTQAEERTKALTAAYATLSAVLKAPESPADPISDSESTGSTADGRVDAGEWAGRIWRRLRKRWQRRPVAPRPNIPPGSRTSRHPGVKRPVNAPRPQRSVPPFERVLNTARQNRGAETASPANRGRWDARRSQYQPRRTNRGPIEPRGPVTPVRRVGRIRPIGEEE